MSSPQSKQAAVERMVAQAQAKVSWGRAIAQANVGLAGKPAPTSRAEDRPRAGWAKVVARINARIRARME